MSDNLIDIMKVIGPEKLREIAGLLENDQYTDLSNDQPEYIPPVDETAIEINIQNPPVQVEPEQHNIEQTCKRSGNYYLKWIVPEGQDGYLSMRDKIHPDTPIISTSKPYIGPLCPHELEFFKGQPGYDYSAYWRFELKERKGKSK